MKSKSILSLVDTSEDIIFIFTIIKMEFKEFAAYVLTKRG